LLDFCQIHNVSRNIMNHSILRFFSGLVAVLLLSQCVAGPQRRIERNPQLFNQLSARDRQLVTSGVIREGMNRDAVFLAWGRPDQVTVGTSRGKEIESWTYVGERPVRTYNMNMGFGFGGWGMGGCGPYGWGGGPFMGGGPAVMYVPYTAGVVEFTRGRVTRWSATPR
jgi:hypothetical protein